MVKYMDINACQALAAEIVACAVQDWRKLCKGKKENKDTNFKNLEIFFKSPACAIYLEPTSITQEDIWAQMSAERTEAICKRLMRLKAGLQEALELMLR